MTVTIRGYRIYLAKGALAALAAVLAFGIFGIVTLSSGGSGAKAIPLAAPAFPTSSLPGLKPGWIARWQKAYPTVDVVDPSQYLASPAGTPVRFDVYIPSPSAYPGYNLQGKGLVFMNAVVIGHAQTIDLTSLGSTVVPVTDRHVVALGFLKGELPPPGQLYQITALLYWRSDRLYPPAVDGTPVYTLPVFLVDGVQQLQPAELRAPATQSAQLDLTFREHGEQVTLEKVEWAAGREVRLLVTLRNLTTSPIAVWNGISGSTAQLPDQATVSSGADPSSPLAGTGELAAQQTIRGYIIFGANDGSAQSVADPNQVLTLRLPSLGPNGDLVLLKLRPTSTP